MVNRIFTFIVLFLPMAVAGCDEAVSPVGEGSLVTPAIGTHFDPATAGTIQGVLTWTGPVPSAPTFLYGVPKADGSFETRMMPNPNAPAIDPKTRNIAAAVVYLRGIDPAAARPWNLPPVRVEFVDWQVVIRQDEAIAGRTGFVRPGDPVTMVAREPLFHILRGRGDDFFSLTFPDPDQPLTRIFKQLGRVELSSGAGYYWASADLYVVGHPYYTLTDRDGRFEFRDVPPGPIEVVAHIPGWDPARQERDPETGLIFRQTYTPALERAQPTTLPAGQACKDVVLTLP